MCPDAWVVDVSDIRLRLAIMRQLLADLRQTQGTDHQQAWTPNEVSASVSDQASGGDIARMGGKDC
jgi:hypothetical protein